jgi:hypothetical protein
MTGAALSWPAAGEAHAVGGGSPLPGAYPSGELGWSSSEDQERPGGRWMTAPK